MWSFSELAWLILLYDAWSNKRKRPAAIIRWEIHLLGRLMLSAMRGTEVHGGRCYSVTSSKDSTAITCTWSKKTVCPLSKVVKYIGLAQDLYNQETMFRFLTLSFFTPSYLLFSRAHCIKHQPYSDIVASNIISTMRKEHLALLPPSSDMSEGQKFLLICRLHAAKDHGKSRFLLMSMNLCFLGLSLLMWKTAMTEGFS